MANFWLLLLFVLSACNVAKQPGVVDSGAVSGGGSSAGTTISFAKIWDARAEGGSVITFPVGLSAAQTTTTTVTFGISGSATGGTSCAVPGTDYVTPATNVVIPAGATFANIEIYPCTDLVYEGDETLILTLSGSTPSLGIGAYGSLNVRIVEGLSLPRVGFASVSSASQIEGVTSTSTSVTVTVQLSHASVFPVTAQILSGGEATEDDDFTLSSHTVTFAPGSTTATVVATIIGDDYIESNENIVLTVSGPTNGTVASTATHQIQITADEVPAPMTASMGTLAPVTEAAGVIYLPVTIVGRMASTTSLTYVVDTGASVTAPIQLATLGSDFELSGFSGTTGTLSIVDSGVTSRTVYIPLNIREDALFESAEEFVVTLLGNSNVTVLTGSARIRVNDNDSAPSVAFLNVSQTVSESNTEGAIVVRLVNGSGTEVAAGQDVSITFTTTNNDTEGAVDWALGATTLTIPQGSSRASLPFSAKADDVDEDDEYFDVAFNTFTTGFSGAVGYTSHRVMIVDNTPAAKVQFTAGSAAMTETDVAAAITALQVSLDRPSDRQITLQYITSGTTISSAACGAGHDLSTPGTLTIPAGASMPYTLSGVSLCGDTLYKGLRAANFTLQGASNAVLGAQANMELTITDNETSPGLDISAGVATVDEADTAVSFMLQVQPTGKAFSLIYSVAGTASVGIDHRFPSVNTLYVPASNAVQNIPISANIIDDATAENAETITMTLFASSSDATLGTSVATITINASDPLKLSLGSRHGCGLLSGVVKCWGWGRALGAGRTTDYGAVASETASGLQPVSLGTGFTPVKVVSGKDFSCALSSAGSVKCWGLNTHGQLGLDRVGVSAQSSWYLGDASSEMGNALPALSLGATVTDIQTSAEASHACALLVSGRMKCWGLNDVGQLGYSVSAGTCGDAVPDTTCVGDDFGEVASSSYLTFPTPGLTVTRMAVGDNHTCAQTSDNEVYCWGANSSGALGQDVATANVALSSSTPVAFNAHFDVANMVRISAGADHSCADFLVGSVNESVCWGSGANGVLGQNTTNNAGTAANTLASISASIDYGGGISTITGLRIAGNHACLRASSGATVCWGSNSNGALGNGMGGPVLRPSSSSSVGSYSDVYVGTDFSCAVSGAFQYSCWGSNAVGQLGMGSATNPVTAPGAAVDFL